MPGYLIPVLGSLFLLPMVIGFLALREINRCHEPMRGRWLAIASIVLGQAGIAVAIFAFAMSSKDPVSESASVAVNAAALPVPPVASKIDPARIKILRRSAESSLLLAEEALATGDLDTAAVYLDTALTSPIFGIPEENLNLEQRAEALRNSIKSKQAQKDAEAAKYRTNASQPKPVKGSAVGERDPFAE